MSTLLKENSKKSASSSKDQKHAVIAFDLTTKDGNFPYIDDFKIQQKDFGEIKSIKRMPRNDILGILGVSSLALIHFNTQEKLFSLRHFFDKIFPKPEIQAIDFTYAADNIFLIGSNQKKKFLGWLKIRRPRTYAREIGKLLINEILKGAVIEKGEELPTVSKRSGEIEGDDEEDVEYVSEITEEQSMTVVRSSDKKSNLSKKYKTASGVNDSSGKKSGNEFSSVKGGIVNVVKKSGVGE